MDRRNESGDDNLKRRHASDCSKDESNKNPPWQALSLPSSLDGRVPRVEPEDRQARPWRVVKALRRVEPGLVDEPVTVFEDRIDRVARSDAPARRPANTEG